MGCGVNRGRSAQPTHPGGLSRATGGPASVEVIAAGLERDGRRRLWTGERARHTAGDLAGDPRLERINLLAL